MERRRTAVLISGRGSNMAALIAAARDPAYPATVDLIVSNRPDAAGLAVAAAAGIAVAAFDHKALGSRAALDGAMQAALERHRIDLVACAGFMRIMTAEFIAAWSGRMVNIHPSLLPAFKGLDTHAQALAAGVRLHGCTVHFVSPELDSGAIVGQAAVAVGPGDTAETLAARVLAMEHRLYPHCLSLVASGRATLEDGRTRFADAEAAASAVLWGG